MHPGVQTTVEVSVIRKIRWLVAVLSLLPVLATATPDLVLKDMDGKNRPVKEFIGQGKWTVVAIWSADCPICRREIYHMTFFHDAHHKKDATVLGVSIDGYENKAKALQFIDEQALNFPNLIGSFHDIGGFGAGRFIGTPTFYFFSPRGKFMTQRIGPTTQEEAEAIIESLKSQAGAHSKG